MVPSVTLLFAVQMKLTVDPTLTVCALGSSTVTSMALDGTETHAYNLVLQNKMCHFTVKSKLTLNLNLIISLTTEL